MLLSLSRRYAFLANGKAASSSFEAALGPECELVCSNNRRVGLHPLLRTSGKHMGYETFVKLFERLFRRFLPIEHYFVFGVAREPMRRVESMYRYFSRPQARPRDGFHGRTSFAGFVERMIESHAGGGRRGQYELFRDGRGNLSLNYIVRFEDMAASLARLRDAAGLDFVRVAGLRANVSPAGARVSADQGLRRAFETEFARDYELYESSCDRLLNPWDRSGELDVETALRWLALKTNRFEIAGTLFSKLGARLEAEPGFAVSELLGLLDARGR